MSSSLANQKAWSFKKEKLLSMCICHSSEIVDKEHTGKGKKKPWYNKLWIFQYASFLEVQNRWKQEVLAVIDEVTNWQLLGTLKSWEFKATAYGCRVIRKMKLQKRICFFKMHFVHMLCYTTLEFVCSTTRDWTKAYVIRHSLCYKFLWNSDPCLSTTRPFFPSRALMKDTMYELRLANFGSGEKNSTEHCLGSFMLTPEVC